MIISESIVGILKSMCNPYETRVDVFDILNKLKNIRNVDTVKDMEKTNYFLCFDTLCNTNNYFEQEEEPDLEGQEEIDVQGTDSISQNEQINTKTGLNLIEDQNVNKNVKSKSSKNSTKSKQTHKKKDNPTNKSMTQTANAFRLKHKKMNVEDEKTRSIKRSDLLVKFSSKRRSSITSSKIDIVQKNLSKNKSLKIFDRTSLENEEIEELHKMELNDQKETEESNIFNKLDVSICNNETLLNSHLNINMNMDQNPEFNKS